MKKKKKYILIFLIILFLIGLLVTIFYIPIPCGEMTKGGTFWEGTCSYGPLLIKNIQNGHFFLPFGY